MKGQNGGRSTTRRKKEKGQGIKKKKKEKVECDETDVLRKNRLKE